MNEQFGDWYREADIQPEHETLTKRWTAIELSAEDIDDSGIVGLGRLFHGLTESGATRDVLHKALFEADNAFSTKNTVEVRLLAGVCLFHVAAQQNDQTGHMAAYALVCPTLLGRRSKIFAPSIPEAASGILDRASSLLRQHVPTKRAPVSKLADEAAKIEEAETANNFQQGGPHVRAALEKLRSSIAAVSEKANRLEKAQALYREDSDILWWMTGRYSRDLGQPLKDIGLPGAAIVVGKELADLIEQQPGPVATQAVLNRCLEDVGGNPSEAVTLTTAVNKTPQEWRNQWFAADGNRDLLSLCPLTAAIRHSVDIDGSWGSAAQSLTGVAANTKLSGTELAYQMYRECMFRKLG